MRDRTFSTLDDVIEIKEEINETKQMRVEMRLPDKLGRLSLEHIN